MAILKCIGRTDSYGDTHQFGSYIGFILQYPSGERHTIVLYADEADELATIVQAYVDEVAEDDDDDDDGLTLTPAQGEGK